MVGERSLAILDFVNHPHQCIYLRAVDAVRAADAHDGSKLHIDLGAAFADREVAPHTGVRLRVGSVERYHRIDAAASLRLSGQDVERAGDETVEPARSGAPSTR